MLRKILARAKNEKGSAMAITIWSSIIMLTLGSGAVFMTMTQRTSAARDVSSLKALNVAEAAANEAIESWAAGAKAGTITWNDVPLGTTTGTVTGNDGAQGAYELTVANDANGAAYKLITASGTFNGVTKTAKILVKAFPEVFSYAAASTVKMEIEGEEDEVTTIVGNIYTGGKLKIKAEDGPDSIDLSQAGGTYVGELDVKPEGMSVPFVPGPAIELPEINIDYYRNADNFPDQTVYNIKLDSRDDVPAYLDPYVNEQDKDDHDNEFEIKIPAADIANGLLPWRDGDIVNFYKTTPYEKGDEGDDIRKVKVKIYNNADTPVTLTQTYTCDNFKELEFKGNVKLLPLNGQAIIAYRMKEVEIKGGVQVGAPGNGALIYSYGRGEDKEGKSKGKIELEDQSSLYGSFIQNIDKDAKKEKSKGEIEEGSYIQFDGAFIDKLGQGPQSQFLDFGTFSMKKVYYKQ